ncbi:uncharacterized protein LOC135524783 isoform X2 [Oncorhynchus masou masou]|uniref:uncharacterized protein LOC135524783 isoform X2 n=1 Tax=Oncorhynchus masou masou TaxID=90313 RepID=UPI003182E752
MIATLSPAGSNVEESLDGHDHHPEPGGQQHGGEPEHAAVRQAGPQDHQCGQGQRGHQRQTHQSHYNEHILLWLLPPASTGIKKLKAEVEKLRAALMSSKGNEPEKMGLFQQEILALKSQLTQQEREIAEAHRAWREKLEQAEKHKREETNELQEAGCGQPTTQLGDPERGPTAVRDAVIHDEGGTDQGRPAQVRVPPRHPAVWGPYRRPPLEEESKRKRHWEMDQQLVASKMEELQSAKVELEQEVNTHKTCLRLHMEA